MKRRGRTIGTLRSWLAAVVAITIATTAFAQPIKHCANGAICPPACPMETGPANTPLQVTATPGHCGHCASSVPVASLPTQAVRTRGGCYLSEVPASVAVLSASQKATADAVTEVALVSTASTVVSREETLPVCVFAVNTPSSTRPASASPRGPPCVS